MLINLVIVFAVAVMVTQIATFATTIYLHRCQTHDAFKLPRWLHRTFRGAIWLTTGQVTKEWVAVHRMHHAFSDEVGDPHSPLLFGFWKVQLLDAMLYVRAKNKPEIISTYARDIYEDAWDRWVFNTGIVGPILGTGILYLTLGLWGLLAGLLHALIYVEFLTSCVNAIGHHQVRTGYQNYTREDATNTFNYKWLAWLTGGEGLHNNHHGQPRSAKFTHKMGEPDPAWFIVKWLERHHLAWDIVRPKPLKTV